MSDATKYTIKPLVWRGRSNYAFAVVGKSVVRDNRDNKGVMKLVVDNARLSETRKWDWFIIAGPAMFRQGQSKSKDAAKLAAESAYRKLIAEHLEEVK